MKKLLLILLCLPMIGFGQNFTVTPNGLRDNTNLEKTYVVISTPGKTAEQNYNSALNYIKDIISLNITKDIESKHISYTTNIPHLLDVNNVMSFLPFSANYTTELTFGNDSVLFEITNLDIYMKGDSKFKVIFLGSYLSMNSHAIYIGKKKSKIQQRMKQTKTDIEVYFNNQIEWIDNHFLETVYGCIDVTACNYDVNANIDDGSCILPGCGDTLYLEYDSTATCFDEKLCLTLKNEVVTNIEVKSKSFFNLDYTPNRFLNAHSVDLLRQFDRTNFEVLDYYGKAYYSCKYLVRDINNKTGFIFENCDFSLNAKIDKENMTEVLEKKKPINIIGVAIEEINSADGVDISITWQYLDTSKDIKYLYFTIAPYNCVGDPVKGRYDNGSKIGKITGPIYGSDERQESHWETFWYNRSICSIKIVKVKVEYMDGSNYTYVKELNKISSPYLKYYSF